MHFPPPPCTPSPPTCFRVGADEQVIGPGLEVPDLVPAVTDGFGLKDSLHIVHSYALCPFTFQLLHSVLVSGAGVLFPQAAGSVSTELWSDILLGACVLSGESRWPAGPAQSQACCLGFALRASWPRPFPNCNTRASPIWSAGICWPCPLASVQQGSVPGLMCYLCAHRIRHRYPRCFWKVCVAGKVGEDPPVGLQP